MNIDIRIYNHKQTAYTILKTAINVKSKTRNQKRNNDPFILMNFYFLGDSIINDTGRQKNTRVSKAINQDI